MPRLVWKRFLAVSAISSSILARKRVWMWFVSFHFKVSIAAPCLRTEPFCLVLKTHRRTLLIFTSLCFTCGTPITGEKHLSLHSLCVLPFIPAHVQFFLFLWRLFHPLYLVALLWLSLGPQPSFFTSLSPLLTLHLSSDSARIALLCDDDNDTVAVVSNADNSACAAAVKDKDGKNALLQQFLTSASNTRRSMSASVRYNR